MKSSTPYTHLLRKYRQLKNRIARLGFGRFSLRKQRRLWKRLKRCESRLARLGISTFGLAALTLPGLEAQTFTLVTDTGSPFILFDINCTSPFGLERFGYFSKPTFVDIDADGDFDAFIGEEYGKIKFYENIGNDILPSFSFSEDESQFGLESVGYYAAPTFVDIDADGDFDAFVGEENNKIAYFENTGDVSNPVFSLPNDETILLDNVDKYSVPAFVDIDADGDFDVFTGEQSGKIKFYENIGSVSSPDFTLLNDSIPFGIDQILGGYSFPTFADIDEDGDFDAFIGGYYGNINYYENVGNASLPSFRLISSINPLGINIVDNHSAPTFVDIDNDGDLDVFVGEYYGNLNYAENRNQNFFPLCLDVGLYSKPILSDIDNDGDLDLFVGEIAGTIKFYENIGDDTQAVFELSLSTAPFGINPQGYYISPAMVDIDSDGDIDIFTGNFDGDISFFENVGNANNPMFDLSDDETPFGLVGVGYDAYPVFVDIDNDGDLDVFVGEQRNNFSYFENIGDQNNPIFELLNDEPKPFGLDRSESFSFLHFVDIDNDGDFDALVGDYSGNISCFQNIGDSTSPVFFLSTNTSFFESRNIGDVPSMITSDLDGDNLLEAVIGNKDGKLSYFESDIPLADIVDTKEIEDQAIVNLFPIPTKNILHYGISQLKNATALHLFDLMGRLVKTERDLDGTIDMSDLPSGQYTLVIEGEGQRVHRLV